MQIRPSCSAGLRRFLAVIALGCLAQPFGTTVLSASAATAIKAAAPIDFNVAAGEASTTLKLFSEQSGQTVVYLVDVVRGEKTAAVKGRFTPREALEWMLAGTDLRIAQDDRTGSLTVRKGAADPNGARAVQSVPSSDRQTANIAAVKDREDAVQLSPFVVNTNRDTGFVAASSLAGGRLSTELQDTPLAYSVITRDFLDALDLTDTESALAWSVGSYAPQADTINYKFSNNEAGSAVISRGIQTGRPQRNFFLLGLNADTYSQERIDFARGPNALLIGTSGLGGVVNGMTKQARFDKSFVTVSANVGSWDRYRGTLDINRRVNDQVAARVNLLCQQAHSWREMVFDRRRGVHLAVSYKPFTHTRIRAETENYVNKTLTAPDSLADDLSGWDGVSTVVAPVATITASDNKGLARLGSSAAQYNVFIPGSDPRMVLNWANTWTTQGGAANANVPVGGVFALSTANLGINAGDIVGSIYQPESRFSRAIAGASFRVPGRRSVLSPDAPTIQYRFNDTAAFIEHQRGEHLFFEAAANYARTDKGVETMSVALSELHIDVNQTLPNGQPNPNFKQAYGEGQNGHGAYRIRTFETRAAAALVFDRTKWGDFRANIIAGSQVSKSYTSRRVEVMNRSPDIRLRSRDDTFLHRYYVNDPERPHLIPRQVTCADPISGTVQTYNVDTVVALASPGSQRWNKTDYNYFQGAANARFWKGRVNLIGGIRRDHYENEAFTVNGSAAAVMNDYPANWDGRTIYYRPSAPGDYWTMSYVPKNTAGVATGPETTALTRPRDSAGVPLPQYANDRFRDDYSSPKVDFPVTTSTYGGVVHMLPWLSVYANLAETFGAPTSGLTLTGAAVPPSMSEGWDTGIRLTLLRGRLVASFGKYGSTQASNSFDSSSSTRKYANIAAANKVGDFSANGMNARGLALIPTPTFDFRDRKANGHEVDIVANLTHQWRFTANASFPEVFTTNDLQDEWAYLKANETTLRQIVLDAGVVINASNVATVDTSIPVANRSPDAAAAATAWNNIQTFKATNDSTAITESALPDYTCNVYTDYRFSSGWFRGFRVGAGIQMLGKRRIGNRANDTIIDPANPARAIDDPAVNSATLVFRPSYYTATATFGYQYKFARRQLLEINLRILNLLGNDDLIAISAGLRPPNGDIRRPDRVTVPIAFLLPTPRSFSLTATLSF